MRGSIIVASAVALSLMAVAAHSQAAPAAQSGQERLVVFEMFGRDT